MPTDRSWQSDGPGAGVPFRSRHPTYSARRCRSVRDRAQSRRGRRTPRVRDRPGPGWRRSTPSVRDRARPCPYMHLQPHNLLVQGRPGTAVVTLTLGGGAAPLNRCTIVLRPVGNSFAIVHLHGFTLPPAGKAITQSLRLVCILRAGALILTGGLERTRWCDGWVCSLRG